MENEYKMLSEYIKDGDHMRDIGVDSRITLKLMLRKLSMKWLRLGSNSGLVSTMQLWVS
jgi:hypothetical protein